MRRMTLNENLHKLLKMNEELMEKSRLIQEQAKNGDLFKRIKFPDINPLPPYKLPAGWNRLSKMKEEDPAKYKDYEKNYSSLFTLKQSLDEINRNLR
jgi:hypothetical protein